MNTTATITPIKKRNKQSIQADHLHDASQRALDSGLSPVFVAGLHIGQAVALIGTQTNEPELEIIRQLQMAIDKRNKLKAVV